MADEGRGWMHGGWKKSGAHMRKWINKTKEFINRAFSLPNKWGVKGPHSRCKNVLYEYKRTLTMHLWNARQRHHQNDSGLSSYFLDHPSDSEVHYRSGSRAWGVPLQPATRLRYTATNTLPILNQGERIITNKIMGHFVEPAKSYS
jgi:hypothetical protein